MQYLYNRESGTLTQRKQDIKQNFQDSIAIHFSMRIASLAILLVTSSFALLPCSALEQTQLLHTVVLSKKINNFPRFINGKIKVGNDTFLTKNEYAEAAVVCSFEDANNNHWYTYEAFTDKLDPKNVTGNYSAASSYWYSWEPVLNQSDILVSSTPIIFEAPRRPLEILPLAGCELPNKAAFVENNKTMEYAVIHKYKQPIEFSHLEWWTYREKCMAPNITLFDGNHRPTTSSTMLYSVMIVFMVMLPARCCYKYCCCVVHLKPNDPLLKEKMDIRIKLEIAKSNRESVDEIKKLEEKLKEIRKKIKEKLHSMKREAIERAEKKKKEKRKKKQSSTILLPNAQKTSATRWWWCVII